MSAFAGFILGFTAGLIFKFFKKLFLFLALLFLSGVLYLSAIGILSINTSKLIVFLGSLSLKSANILVYLFSVTGISFMVGFLTSYVIFKNFKIQQEEFEFLHLKK